MPLLNTATKVYAGSALATKVYRGAVQVWPPAPAFGAEQFTYNTVATEGVLAGTGTWANDVLFSVAGRITAVRYYYWSNQANTHTVRVWSSGGVQLGNATPPRGAAGSSGWQRATLTTPITITAGTTCRVCVENPGNDNMARAVNPAGDTVVGTITRYRALWRGIDNQYPTNASGSPRPYFADVVFEPAL